jgi:hypothetical protein
MEIPEIIDKMITKEMRPLLAVVDTVDMINRTVDVTTVEDDIPLTDLKLSSVPSGDFVMFPAEGSVVGVVMRGESDGWVVMYGSIDSIQWGDGANDGLIKINDLVTKLNNLENDINSLKTAMSTWIVVAGDGGAALKAIASTWFGTSLTPTVKTDLENNTITHGDL